MGRQRKYASDADRVAAYRERKRQAAADAARRYQEKMEREHKEREALINFCRDWIIHTVETVLTAQEQSDTLPCGTGLTEAHRKVIRKLARNTKFPYWEP